MGGQNKTTESINQTTQPWQPAQGTLQSLLGQLNTQAGRTGLTGMENSALNALQGNASNGNPYAGRIADFADTLLTGGNDRTGMVNDAYSQYQQALTPFARGDYVDPFKNPALQGYLQQAGDAAANRANSLFASAGRDFSGAHAKALGSGVASATAPILYDAYNQALGQQTSAINNLYNAGGQTASLLSGLDQTALGNKQAGIGASQSALQAQDSPFMQTLAIEAQRRGIPMEQMAQLVGMTVPIAGLGSQTQGTTTKSTEMPFMNQLAGGLIGGAGLLGQMGAFGPAGWLYGGASGLIPKFGS